MSIVGWIALGFSSGFSYSNVVSAVYLASPSTSAKYLLSSTPGYGTYSWMDAYWTSLHRHVYSFLVGRPLIFVNFLSLALSDAAF